MTKKMRTFWLSLCSALLFGFTTPAFADDTADSAEAEVTAGDVEQLVQTETEKQASERRKKIMQEAVDALARTKDALAALEEERVDDALDALALTTGKLELIVVREPSLALAPTDVTITTHDLYGSTAAIKAAIKRAEDALEDGRLQEARHILDGLGSEMIITVANLPLATYPDAIKAITPMIDEGNIEEAKASLQTALNTLVLTDQVVPLPVLRFEALLQQAEELAVNDERTEAEDEQLVSSLEDARAQLEMAQLLGYGDKGDYRPIYKQLEQIEKEALDGDTDEGVFAKLRDSISDLLSSTSS